MSEVHIVVVNFTRMGDLVQCGPLLRSLKSVERNTWLTLVALDAFCDIAARLPMVDEVIGFDIDRFVPLLDRRTGNLADACGAVSKFVEQSALDAIDVLYNLSHTPQSATLCSLLKAWTKHGLYRRKDGTLGVQGEWFNYLFTVMQERRWNPFNLVEIYLRIHPMRSPSLLLELDVRDMDRINAARLLRESGLAEHQEYVVLQPGASHPSRQWPAASFAGLARRLADTGWRSVIVGSRDETALAADIAATAGGAAISVCGLTSIADLAGILTGAKRLISNDTGTIHVAAAVGTPTIGIYVGPAAAKDTAPFGDGHVVIEPDLPCAPCSYQRACAHLACHRMVKVEDVLALATAPPEDLEQRAAAMTGVRVIATSVRGGRIHLRTLNCPVNVGDLETLEGWRDFWDRLLSDHASPEPSPIERLAAPREVLLRLQTILRQAEHWLEEMRLELTGSAPQKERVTTLLRAQSGWQEELRRFADEGSEWSMLPRYLLVRLTTVPGGDVQAYLDYLGETVRMFRRGVDLLPAGQTVKKKRSEIEQAVA
jgi:ADP-heptose:LPS heptosyltransferase